MTVARLVAEIVALLVSLVVIQWLASRLLETEGFWPSMVYSAICIGIRAFLFGKNTRFNMADEVIRPIRLWPVAVSPIPIADASMP